MKFTIYYSFRTFEKPLVIPNVMKATEIYIKKRNVSTEVLHILQCQLLNAILKNRRDVFEHTNNFRD